MVNLHMIILEANALASGWNFLMIFLESLHNIFIVHTGLELKLGLLTSYLRNEWGALFLLFD